MTTEKFHVFLKEFKHTASSFPTRITTLTIEGKHVPVFTNEYWTARQRQANSIHEVSYRACFKPQLPRFFISLFSELGDTVYDPFNGRGTTAVEAALLGRNVIANDVNPISLIFTHPRISIPTIDQIQERLSRLKLSKNTKSDMDLSMFFHRDTLGEIVALKKYLAEKKASSQEDVIDQWIRMVATNRLTGHSNGFFSVYTLPPNQAVSVSRQIKINETRNQIPEYRDVKKIILKKSKTLLKDIKFDSLLTVSATFLNADAASTNTIPKESVTLTITSPPFLDVVQYAQDNWMRCWFNDVDVKEVAAKITMSKTIEEWSSKMQNVFAELYRITKPGGRVAFEVGEVRKGKVKLEEAVIPIAQKVGFTCEAVVINEQEFTKTANIWGVDNNNSGTNSNRIVVLRKIGRTPKK